MNMTNKQVAEYIKRRYACECSHTNISHAKRLPEAKGLETGVELGELAYAYKLKHGKWFRGYYLRNDECKRKQSDACNPSACEIDGNGKYGDLHFHNCNVTVKIYK